MQCPDLEKSYGSKYLLSWDESRKREKDPWLRQIPCVRGHVYVHGPGELGVALDGRVAATVKKLTALGCRVVQDGSDGANLVFPVALFPAVAKIVRPHRRRKLSVAHRQGLSDRLPRGDVALGA